ncbi:MAG: glycine cleavage system protein GcvH [Desulfovibrionaceae bacterium]|nr:glycine cleavage system protein GcvH [Desulfovibrionaceae bacterium]
MKTKDQLILPADYKYTDEHIWIKASENSYLIGISDFAQDQLGEISYIELPEVGAHFDTHVQFGTVESLKSVNALYMPLSGTIEAVNNDLEDTPTLANIKCYEDGWIARITLDNPNDLGTLLDANSYLDSLK